jgi:hypothetical protein
MTYSILIFPRFKTNVPMPKATGNVLLPEAGTTNTTTDADLLHLEDGVREHTESGRQADDLQWMTTTTGAIQDAPHPENMGHLLGAMKATPTMHVDRPLQLVAMPSPILLETETPTLVPAAHPATGTVVGIQATMSVDTRSMKTRPYVCLDLTHRAQLQQTLGYQHKRI